MAQTHRYAAELKKLYNVPSPDLQKRFHATFKKPLNYFYNVLGFDIVKFDEYLKTPDGVSTRDEVSKRFGQVGVDLVLEVLK